MVVLIPAVKVDDYAVYVGDISKETVFAVF
jgi:hypothetical protein